MKCNEDPEMKLGDGTVRIFLNTHGSNEEEVSPELIELLHYMEYTDNEFCNKAVSESLKKLGRRVEAIKSSEEVSVRYMQEWEERELERREALEEGEERFSQLLQILIENGRMEDVKRISADKSYRNQLYQEYGI